MCVFCVLHKVLYHENSKMSFLRGIAIMGKQIAFRDRDTLNSNPV